MLDLWCVCVRTCVCVSFCVCVRVCATSHYKRHYHTQLYSHTNTHTPRPSAIVLGCSDEASVLHAFKIYLYQLYTHAHTDGFLLPLKHRTNSGACQTPKGTSIHDGGYMNQSQHAKYFQLMTHKQRATCLSPRPACLPTKACETGYEIGNDIVFVTMIEHYVIFHSHIPLHIRHTCLSQGRLCHEVPRTRFVHIQLQIYLRHFAPPPEKNIFVIKQSAPPP